MANWFVWRRGFLTFVRQKLYREANKDLIPHNQKLVKDTSFFNSLIYDGGLPPTAKNLIITTHRTYQIYFLPESPTIQAAPLFLHAVAQLPELVSNYLDSFMLPIVEILPTYYKNANHALRILNYFQFHPESKFLFTINVKYLYTVIPTDEGLYSRESARNLFDRCTVKT